MVIAAIDTEENARRIIDTILEEKLAACMQTLNIGSHYIWKNSIHHTDEVLILFKTSWNLYDRLESRIRQLHPYDTPEIIAIDIEKGLKKYLDWIDEVTI